MIKYLLILNIVYKTDVIDCYPSLIYIHSISMGITWHRCGIGK